MWRRKKGWLSSLIHFDAPLGDIEAGLATLGWGSEPVDTLTREHVADILQRVASGEIDAVSVEAWANLVEGRDDIQFEPGHEQVVLDAVHDLAIPVLEGRLANIVPAVLGEALLRGVSSSVLNGAHPPSVVRLRKQKDQRVRFCRIKDEPADANPIPPSALDARPIRRLSEAPPATKAPTSRLDSPSPDYRLAPS